MACACGNQFCEVLTSFVSCVKHPIKDLRACLLKTSLEWGWITFVHAPMRLKWIYTSVFVTLKFLCFQTRRFHYFSEDGYDVDGPRPFEVTVFVIVILKPLPAHFSLFPPRVAFSLNPCGDLPARSRSSLALLGWFSCRTETSVDDGERKLNNWLDQWQSVNWAPEVVFSPFRALSRRQLSFLSCC